MMKIEVLNPPRENGDCYRLLESVAVSAQGVDAPDFEIPRGFESDGASVPNLLSSFVFSSGDARILEDAFAHDYIYRHHPKGWTRAKADRLFYRRIRKHGINFFHANRAWLGLRLFGWKAWNSKGFSEFSCTHGDGD